MRKYFLSKYRQGNWKPRKLNTNNVYTDTNTSDFYYQRNKRYIIIFIFYCLLKGKIYRNELIWNNGLRSTYITTNLLLQNIIHGIFRYFCMYKYICFSFLGFKKMCCIRSLYKQTCVVSTRINVAVLIHRNHRLKRCFHFTLI